MRKRIHALTSIPLIAAVLGLTLFAVTPQSAMMGSAGPNVTVNGYPGPGDVVAVGGGNWPYNDPISIAYDGTIVTTTNARFMLGVAGPAIAAFLATVQIPVTTTMGTHTITATDTNTSVSAQTTITVGAEWKQFGFTSSGTRNNPYETAIGVNNVANLTLDWTFNSGENAPFPIDPIYPSAANGNVFVAVNHVLFELNSATGQQIWANGTGFWTYGAPAIATNAIYTTQGFLWRFDAATGAVEWRTSDYYYSESPVIANGMVYVNRDSSGRAWVEAYAASCGQSICAPVWRYIPPGGAMDGTLSVTNGSVYTTNSNSPGTSGLASGSNVIAVDAQTGALQWYGQLGDNEGAFSTLEDNGYLIVSADAEVGTTGYPGGTLYVFPAAGCGQATCAPLWTSYSAEGFGRAAAVANGVIYIGGQDGALNAFNESGCGQATCSPLWQSAPSAKAPTWRTPTPAIANGVVYFPNWSPGAIQAFDAAGCGAATCAPLWSYTLNPSSAAATASGSPIIVSGALYQSDDTGVLYAFHLPTATSQRSSHASVASAGTSKASSSKPAPLLPSAWLVRMRRYKVALDMRD